MTSTLPFQAVLWDMDGTLIDSEPCAIRALRRASREAGIDVPEANEARIYGMAADEIYAWLQRDFGLALPASDWEALKLAYYFEESASIAPIANAVDVWTSLVDLGMRQAVVSNSDRQIVSFNCSVLGINRPGLVTISRNDVRSGKPSPEGYLRAAHLLGVPPERCAVVEDSVSGLTAGLEAGMHVFCVPHPAASAPLSGATYTTSFPELKACLTGSGTPH